MKYQNQRKCVLKKNYVVFVCLATCAIHLKITTDTQGFISCFKRYFLSGIGKSLKIFTCFVETFVGAATIIRKLFNQVKFLDEPLAGYLSFESIERKFIPSKAPNFVILWKACVRSFKRHFKKVVGYKY